MKEDQEQVVTTEDEMQAETVAGIATKVPIPEADVDRSVAKRAVTSVAAALEKGSLVSEKSAEARDVKRCKEDNL